MTHPTDRAATHQPLDQLIAEAKDAAGILPTIDRCTQLRDELRPTIRRLADEVRRRQDTLLLGSDWERCERALLKAQAALCGSFGFGLRSAAIHVKTLGEAAETLAACIQETG